MKRTIVIGLLGTSAALLLGCPVFSDNNSYSCGACPAQRIYCTTSNDCPSGYSCEDNECILGFADGSVEASTDASDCTVTGCPSGQQCQIVDGGVASCVGTKDSGPSTDGGGDALPPFKGCTSNAQCTSADGGAGSLCLDGTCVPPANQCSDATQCASNEDCVQGACVPTCSSAVSCPTGYSCDLTNGVCTGNPTPCGGADGGAACTGGTTCVDQHCVPTCSSGDAACGTGLVCVDNGCVPQETPIFVCNTDGMAGDGKTGDCDVGSICLHHACYISCDPEASNSCVTADMFPICKSVTTTGGTYYVCGSSTNLGNQCDPTRGLDCTGTEICIDGYCR
jgi:hypothetical protein